MVGNSLTGDVLASDRRRPGTLAARSAVLKAVADPTRLAVLERLADLDRRCHCDLELDLAVPANRLSFHLKVLRDAGLIVASRDGQRVNYHLADDALERLHATLPAVGQGTP